MYIYIYKLEEKKDMSLRLYFASMGTSITDRTPSKANGLR